MYNIEKIKEINKITQFWKIVVMRKHNIIKKQKSTHIYKI